MDKKEFMENKKIDEQMNAKQANLRKKRTQTILAAIACCISWGTVGVMLIRPASTMTHSGIEEQAPDEIISGEDASSLDVQDGIVQDDDGLSDGPLFEEAGQESSVQDGISADDGISYEDPAIIGEETETETETETGYESEPEAVSGTAAESESISEQAEELTFAETQQESEAAMTAAGKMTEESQSETAAAETLGNIPEESEVGRKETEAVSETEKAAETDAVKETSSESEKAPEEESETVWETGPETEAVSETESEPETEAVTETESESETEAVTETESESETEAVTETESESETEAVTETESESETETVTETESESEKESESETETEAVSEEETEMRAADAADLKVVDLPSDQVSVGEEGKELLASSIREIKLRKNGKGWTENSAAETEAVEVTDDQKLHFRIEYSIKQKTLSDQDDTLIYQVPEEITRIDPQSGEIRDTEGNTVAQFIAEESGKIRVTFDKQYVSLNQDQPVECVIQFTTEGRDLVSTETESAETETN